MTSCQITEEQLLEPLGLLFNQKINKFPGTLPVSIDAKNVNMLRYGFTASLKADGERVFCFISRTSLILMRRNKQYKVFSVRTSFVQDFIFDAEWLDDQNLILIYDTLLFCNTAAWRLDYLQRVELALHFLTNIVPLAERSSSSFGGEKTQEQAELVVPLPSKYDYSIAWETTSLLKGGLRVCVKPIYSAEKAAVLWNERHRCPYTCDGIIFTRLWCAYRPFSDSTTVSVMKWKPCVTLDFVVQPVVTNHEPIEMTSIPDNYDGTDVHDFCHPSNELQRNCVLQAMQDGCLVSFSSCVLEQEVLHFSSSFVCEFSWSMEEQEWMWERLRTDKTTPNTIHTILSCLKSITDDMDINSVVSAILAPKPIM